MRLYVLLLTVLGCAGCGVNEEALPTDVDWPSGDLPVAAAHAPQAGGITFDPIALHEPADPFTVVASGQSNARGLHAAAGEVLWTTVDFAGQARVVRVQAASGAREITALGRTSPRGGVAYDDTHYFWADVQAGTLWTALRGVAGAKRFADPLGFPRGIASSPSQVFWVTAVGDLVFASKSAPAPRILTTGPSGPTAIAVDADHLYWSTEALGALLRMPLAGGAVETIFLQGLYSSNLAFDADRVYWANADKRALMSVAKGGGEASLVAEDVAGGVAVDAGFVYFIGAGGTVDRAGKDGSGRVALASGLVAPTEVAVDGDRVYVIDTGLEAVLRLPRSPE